MPFWGRGPKTQTWTEAKSFEALLACCGFVITLWRCMTGFDVFIILGLLALLGLQGWATVRVFRSDLYERDQKWMQAKLI